MRRTTSVAIVVVLLLALPDTGIAQQFLRSIYDLEDPRAYCLDIPGFGQTMQIDAPIYTHSCKYGLPGFDIDEIVQHTAGKLRFVNFDRCIAADPLARGAQVPLLPNIEDAAVPLPITVAQYDPQPFLIGTARLYARLIDDFGVRPRLHQIPGHGHISCISAVGTADTLFLEEALDFLLNTP